MTANVGLPLLVARSMHRRMPTASLDDLIGDGMEGLVRAAGTWNPERGPFPQYATLRIRGAMLDGVRRMDFMSRHTRRLHGGQEGRWSAPCSLEVATTDNLVLAGLLAVDEDGFAVVDALAEYGPAIRRMVALRPLYARVVVELARGRSQGDVGADLGLTASRVSQIRKQAAAFIVDYQAGRRRWNRSQDRHAA